MQISPSIARRNLFIPPARRNLFFPPTRQISMKISALTLTKFSLIQILGGFRADSGRNTDTKLVRLLLGGICLFRLIGKIFFYSVYYAESVYSTYLS